MWYIICVLIGFLAGGWYASYFNKCLIKQGYLKYELTEKFMNEFINKKNNENRK